MGESGAIQTKKNACVSTFFSPFFLFGFSSSILHPNVSNIISFLIKRRKESHWYYYGSSIYIYARECESCGSIWYYKLSGPFALRTMEAPEMLVNHPFPPDPSVSAVFSVPSSAAAAF